MSDRESDSWYRLGLGVGLSYGVWVPFFLGEGAASPLAIALTFFAVFFVVWGLWGLVARKKDAPGPWKPAEDDF